MLPLTKKFLDYQGIEPSAKELPRRANYQGFTKELNHRDDYKKKGPKKEKKGSWRNLRGSWRNFVICDLGPKIKKEEKGPQKIVEGRWRNFLIWA